MLGFIAFLLLLQTRRQLWQNVLLIVMGVMIALIGFRGFTPANTGSRTLSADIYSA
jgi:hypothetical protein